MTRVLRVSGLELDWRAKSKATLKSKTKFWLKFLSVASCQQKIFIFGPLLPWMGAIYIMTTDARVLSLGWDWRSKSKASLKNMTKFWLKILIASCHKPFIFGPLLPWRVGIYMTADPRVPVPGGAGG